MWQSRVEIEHYSVAYFDCFTTFEALHSIKAQYVHVLCKLVRYSCIYAAHTTPALYGRSTLQYFERGRNTQWNNIRLLPGTATYTTNIILNCKHNLHIILVLHSKFSYSMKAARTICETTNADQVIPPKKQWKLISDLCKYLYLPTPTKRLALHVHVWMIHIYFPYLNDDPPVLLILWYHVCGELFTLLPDGGWYGWHKGATG